MSSFFFFLLKKKKKKKKKNRQRLDFVWTKSISVKMNHYDKITLSLFFFFFFSFSLFIVEEAKKIATCINN